MDIFPLVAALLPLATYFLILGGLRLTRRPLVTTGTRDFLAVAVAVSGLVMIGPIHLFFPSMAAAELGWYVWVVLGVFYLLCVTLLLLSWSPRIVIYGMRSRDALEPVLAAAKKIDEDARSDEESKKVFIPKHDVTLRIDTLGITDAVQVEAFEKNLHPRFWRVLLIEIRREASSSRVPISLGGMSMLIVGMVMLAFTTMQAMGRREELLAGFREWLNV